MNRMGNHINSYGKTPFLTLMTFTLPSPLSFGVLSITTRSTLFPSNGKSDE